MFLKFKNYLLLTCISTLLLSGFYACKKTDYKPSGFMAQPITDTLPYFVAIKGGTYIMGSPKNEPGRDTNEKQHTVNISSFYMQQTEVTRAQYLAFLSSPDAHYLLPGQKDTSDYNATFIPEQTDVEPIIRVTWLSAARFCNYMSKKAGLKDSCYKFNQDLTVECDISKPCYRLPTEAEWEYAARGGQSTPYHTGWIITYKAANYEDGYKRIQRTSPVADYPPNSFGLYDMAGNVWEWCNDWYAPYETQGIQTNPTGPKTKPTATPYHVFRGGSWYYGANTLRSAFRAYSSFTDPSNELGFRLARSK